MAEYQARRAAEFQSRERELTTRPADIAVQILARHIPTLTETARPHIRRDDYGVLTIGSEFDSEIKYFVERVILADPAYMSASRAAISIDPDARARLFESSAVVERRARNAIVKRWQDDNLLANWPRAEFAAPNLIDAACPSVSARRLAFAICLSFSSNAGFVLNPPVAPMDAMPTPPARDPDSSSPPLQLLRLHRLRQTRLHREPLTEM